MMEKQKRWHFLLILSVIILTIYNILPTVFYYSRPLKRPIGEEDGHKIASCIVERVDALEKETGEWLQSFCRLLQVKPEKITWESPSVIALFFKKEEEATRLRTYLPKAGAKIPFPAKQLSLYPEEGDSPSSMVRVQRSIPLHLEKNEQEAFFRFSPKWDHQGRMTSFYQTLVHDRALKLYKGLIGEEEPLPVLLKGMGEKRAQDHLVFVAQKLLTFTEIFGKDTPIAQRYSSHLAKLEGASSPYLSEELLLLSTKAEEKIGLERRSLEEEKRVKKAQGAFLDTAKQERLEHLLKQEKTLRSFNALVKHHPALFSLKASQKEVDFSSSTALNHHPFFASLAIDAKKDAIHLTLQEDFVTFCAERRKDPSQKALLEKAEQLLYEEIGSLTRYTEEAILPSQEGYSIALAHLPNSKSIVALSLEQVGKAYLAQIRDTIEAGWKPQHPDLQRGNFPVWDSKAYAALPKEERQLGLVLYTPSDKEPCIKGFHNGSLYVIAKGVDKILQRLRDYPEAPEAKQFIEDFQKLKELLQRQGFVGYAASSSLTSPEYAQDLIFEKEAYFQNLLAATREDFYTLGSKSYAILECRDLEERILTQNKIANRLHEELLQWRDDYKAAKLRQEDAYTIPEPTRNVYLDNFLLSFTKYFRGDERKILHWGLDLSGGKTVQIELRDSQNRLVTESAAIKTGLEELYQRVNRMGVSEVSIRQEGHHLTLDFPGAQALSAEDLIQASSLSFHVVNEKFSLNNPQLAPYVNQFLQEVWNEAVITNRKQEEEVQEIALRHLYGSLTEHETSHPHSEAAKVLYEKGLRLADPKEVFARSTFDDSYTKVALLQTSDYKKWQGQTHPLVFVFYNYALQGGDIEDVQAAYDPTHGNFLSFKVKKSQVNQDLQKYNPQEDLKLWSSRFSKEKSTEEFTQGKGWRMAIIVNGSIVSTPVLNQPLSESALIQGHFTQREATQLAADLKAGALSFTPRILAEKNVSPELGAHERYQGILATFLALVLVIGVMISYYRFGGLIASIAVIFNLLLIWATLQNLQATITLAGLAGIILTVGMAVDANVLVFERIKEEFALSGRIAAAINAGYKKAFSAILDSNLTTIIAALILLQFDAGPIKGFAVTLLIGILSSLFTALFMTRYFFAGWVQNPQHKTLNMANTIRGSRFDFFKFTRPILILSSLVLIGGLGFLVKERKQLIGMDFTGGYTLSLDLKPQEGVSYRSQVEKALCQKGVFPHELQVRELTPASSLRLFMSKSLDEPGRPFANLEESSSFQYPYESNPKIRWIVHALQDAQIPLSSPETLDKGWSSMSGQMSASMRNQALIGLVGALLCILIYITIRFELAYALSATLCLAHDLLFTLAAIGILHGFKVPVQIDWHTLAAFMTIIGYSLNDTIIVFDRIREDLIALRKTPLPSIFNHALNVTLSRTLMTSGTTLLVLIPLILLGGSTLFGFALVMAIGVVFGTLSSLFLAAPLLKWLMQRLPQGERARGSLSHK